MTMPLIPAPHLVHPGNPMQDRRSLPAKTAFARLALRAAAGIAVLLGSGGARAETFDIITKLVDTPTKTVWRIDRPNVKQPLQEYPEITFTPGDRVSIAAGGCVQTGGVGKTWKRYVNPSGPSSGSLYHGLIRVPGLNPTLVRLQQFGLNAEHTVGPIPVGPNGADAHLQLGYEDDNHSDNGYERHDDGTDDQCQNVPPAFVVVSVGRMGAAPPSASTFLGIGPTEFRCQAAWSFKNFRTSRLTLESFTDAFDFQAWDYLDPAVGIVFLAARDSLAAGGNCMGMAFLADAVENQFVVGDLQENLWDNYTTATVDTPPPPHIEKAINAAHWAQMSATFLNYYLNNVIRSPAENARLVEASLAKGIEGNYGMISIAHGTKGHVVVPLAVRHVGAKIEIDVYDPNQPCTSRPDTATYFPIVIDGDQWSFVKGSPWGPGETWTGSTANDGLAYVPYTGANGWRRFGADFAGVIQLIFGSDTKVEQVTDAQGRKLFISGTQTIDASPTGLGKFVVRMPNYGARPRDGDAPYRVSNPNKPALSPGTFSEFERKYGADYRDLEAAFLVRSVPDLAGLTFHLSTAGKANKSVRALIRQRGQFLEVNAKGVSPLTLTIPRPASLAANGITLKNDGNRPTSAVFTMGQRTDGAINVQTTSPISLDSAQLAVRSTATGITVTSPAARAEFTVKEEMTTTAGRRSSPLKRTRIQPQ